MKKNCWEYFKCGREPGGVNARKMGVCPAATETRTHRIHGGTNGGRVCWVIAGTFCDGEVQGTYAEKLIGCIHCKFYNQVMNEEGGGYISNVEIFARMNKKKT